jgi:hypothetical protein
VRAVSGWPAHRPRVSPQHAGIASSVEAQHAPKQGPAGVTQLNTAGHVV